MDIITLPLGSYQTNCYLVSADDSNRCVVIDPGYSPEQVLLATLDMALDADRAHPILTAVQTAE